MWKWVRRMLWLLVGALVVAAAALLWASGGRGDAASVLSEPVERTADVPDSAIRHELRRGRLRVGTYNIAYGRGAGGDTSGPWPLERFERHLTGIAERLREWDLDVVALQEVDLDAGRSHHMDQASHLAQLAGYPYYACVVTWKNNYVPFPYWPPAKHYGRMKTGQCVLSRFPLVANTRYRLEQPAENPFWYNWFYLHRAIQHVTVDIGATEPLHVFNIHLEAYGTPNRQAQADRLVAVVREHAGAQAVVLGDFNALPPQATKKFEFSDEPDMDFRGDDTMRRVAELGWDEALTGHPESATFTFPAPAGTRRLDYLFFKGFRVERARVGTDAGGLSDHLPIIALLGV